MASEKSIIIDFTTDFEEALVATYGNMLVGVFENILRNAIHYTPTAGSIDIRLSHKNDENFFAIEIADSGTGVPDELLQDIFQPFFRTDSARDRESGGHGLGLAIAHRSVTLHYGKIWAENKTGGGLKITVEIPALPAQDDE